MLVLFLNGRPVDCSPLKRAIEGVYGSILPKNAKPFAFLDVRVPPRAVDVNVHPTKQEVRVVERGWGHGEWSGCAPKQARGERG